jgi:uncharacterized membrane protein YcaP (DUF421 family)
MTPATLSSVILRFVAVALIIYGIVLLAQALIGRSEIAQMQSTFNAIASLSSDSSDANQVTGLTVPMSKMIRILFISSGSCLVIGVFLFWSSRKLGSLIARGL